MIAWLPRCWMGLWFIGALGCGKPTAPPVTTANEWFEEVAKPWGVDFTLDPGSAEDYFMPLSMVGGAACFDYDGDGLFDLLFLQASRDAQGKPNQLFRQVSPGRFENVSAGSGLDFSGMNMGVAIGDVNEDGKPDVLISQYLGIQLLLNQGNGRFVNVTEIAGLKNPSWGSSCSFLDFNRDGLLDLLVVNYVGNDPNWTCREADGKPDFCGPKTFPPLVTRLYQNLGTTDGKPVSFEDVTVRSGLAAKPGPGLGVCAMDWTGDHWVDILVSNDGQPNHLWVNQKNSTFKEEAFSRGVAFNGMGNAFAGMGIAPGDMDNDGRLDFFITHLGKETHTLWRQVETGQFRDVSATIGVSKTTWRGTGFGTVMADFDCDGALDMAWVNGRISRGPPEGATHLPEFWQPYAERNQLLRQKSDGTFEDVSTANPSFSGKPNVARGLLAADLDGDGRQDLVVIPTAEPVRIYRNRTKQNHWLKVRLEDSQLRNRSMQGAEVRVVVGGKTYLRVYQPSESYLCCSAPELVFGLGSASKFDHIEITWPDGKTELLAGGATNRLLRLQPGIGP